MTIFFPDISSYERGLTIQPATVAVIAKATEVWGAYIPRWYWQQVGGDLSSLGVAIVASGYPGGYSDTDANWNAYGGVSPLIWQYTDAQPYGGQRMDFNAFRGSVPELAALVNGTTPPPPAPPAPPNNQGGSTVGTISPAISQFWPELAGQFPANATFADDTALIWADAGARAAALYAKQARDAINDLAGRIAAPPAVDVGALAAAIAPHLAGGSSADEIASAVAKHLGAALSGG